MPSTVRNQVVSSLVMFFRKNKVSAKRCLGMKEIHKKAKHLNLSLFMEGNKLVAFKDLKRTLEAKF